MLWGSGDGVLSDESCSGEAEVVFYQMYQEQERLRWCLIILGRGGDGVLSYLVEAEMVSYHNW